MVDPPCSFFFFNIPAFEIPPEQGQLEHVDDDCPEDEEEVDEDPEGKGRYTLSNLRRLSYQLCLYVLLTKGAKNYIFTSGDEVIVETKRAVRERNKVTRSPIRPGTT